MISRHTCKAKGCGTAIPATRLFCLPHWRRLPTPLRAKITAHYRRGQEVDKNPNKQWVAVAREAIKWLSDADAKMTPIDGELDPGIANLVNLLRLYGYDTFSSCQGGEGHAFQNPTVLIRPSGDMTEQCDRLAKLLSEHGHGGYYLKVVNAHQGDPWPVPNLSFIEVEFWGTNREAEPWKARAEALFDIARAAADVVGNTDRVRILNLQGQVAVDPAALAQLEKALNAYQKLGELCTSS